MDANRGTPIFLVDALVKFWGNFGDLLSSNTSMRASVGPYVIDTLALSVTQSGQAVAIEPKVFDLLVLLLQNGDRVVTRDEIVEKVWAGRIISDASLSSCVQAARRALGDSGKAQDMIRTIHRRGFRFVGAVAEDPATKRGDPGGRTAVPAPERSAGSERSAQATMAPSIAVLPFLNLSADPQQDFVAEGLAEDILTTLSKIRHLLVIDAQSSSAYKGRSIDARKVGEELDVRYVLQGSVQMSAGQLRVSAQLVDCTTGALRWSDRFEGSTGDLFALQDRVTEDVVTALEVELTEGELVLGWRKRSGIPKAYEAYHRARDFFMEFTREGSARACAEATRALQINPEFWDAWLMLGYASNMSARLGWSDNPARSLQVASECVDRVKAADASIPEAYSLAGGIALTRRDFQKAIDECRRAVTLGPNSADCHHMCAITLSHTGRPGEAIGLERHALRLNPLGLANYLVELGRAYVHLGRFEEARSVLLRVIDRRPRWMNARVLLIGACGSHGLETTACEQARAILRLKPAFRLGAWQKLQPYRDVGDLDGILAVARRAGLPD